MKMKTPKKIVLHCPILAGALLLLSLCDHNRMPLVEGMSIGRREMISRATSSTIGGIITSSSAWLSPQVAIAADNNNDDGAPLFSSYQIIPDASPKLDPTLKPINPSDFITKFLSMTNSKRGGTLWLGEHHNSATDHKLQADFIRRIHNQRKSKPYDINAKSNKANMAVGLEMIQVQFQPTLDAYLSHQITSQEMRSQVEWDKRWSWSFENYLPIFETCRELQIPLIALNVDSEDLGLVEIGGFPALPPAIIQKYIPDPIGFANFAKNRYYKTYVDYVISPSYDLHKEMGILRTTITGQMLEEDMSFSRFFSGRILWDEGMASNAFRWTESNEGGLLIGLVGADHVKFEGGITGRYKRLSSSQSPSSESGGGGSKHECISVILNPTLIDTRPSGSVSMLTNSAASVGVGDDGNQEEGRIPISLQLRYLKEGVEVGSPESRLPESTGGVLPLADYIVVSRSS